MNLFGGFGNMFGGGFGRGNDNNCCCSLLWLMFLLSICGCNNDCHNDDGCGCGGIIFLLLLLSCCGCGHNNGCCN